MLILPIAVLVLVVTTMFRVNVAIIAITVSLDASNAPKDYVLDAIPLK